MESEWSADWYGMHFACEETLSRVEGTKADVETFLESDLNSANCFFERCGEIHSTFLGTDKRASWLVSGICDQIKTKQQQVYLFGVSLN